jgi:hypothetical protein
MASHNDMYFFFENDEIERLEKEAVKGIYFNRKDLGITAKLNVTVKDKIHEKALIKVKNNDDGFICEMQLKIWSKNYVEFKEEKKADYHDGFRHIIFRNAANIDGLTVFEQFNYRQLKKYKSEIEKRIIKKNDKS